MLIEYKNGRRKDIDKSVAKVLISRNLARAVEEGEPVTAAPTYQTRMLQAEAPSAPRKTVAKKAVAKQVTKTVARKTAAKRATSDKA